MKKLLFALLLVLCSSGSADAQLLHRYPGRRQLSLENERLRASLDSLRRVADSLSYFKYVQDSITIARLDVEKEEKKPSPTQVTPDMSPEATDSLLALWYRSNVDRDFDAVHSYDMDSVVFSSNVSDEELMRRLSAMKPFFTLPFNETVKNYMVMYSEKMPRSMSRVLGLSRFYFPIFEEAFSRYQIPMELKYMAVVESMLSPTATSRVGARGMWQFMYNTARSYDLQIDSFIDERLDVVKAVDAAARYLRDFYRVFGDWSLAISSYNCGAGNVRKAIRRADGKSDFWSIYPYLPRETRGYVPAMIGVMYAMTYCKEYGIVPENVGMPAQVDTFAIRKKLHLKQINEVVGVPLDELRQLNAQYVHDIIPGSESEPCTINIPFNWTPAFMCADQDSLYSHRSAELLSAEILKGVETGSVGGGQRIVYKVKSGDYLGKIASRYHVSVANIKKWNHLRSDSIRAGQVLYIYK